MSKIRYASFSECGVRTNNEDYIQIIGNPDDGRYLFVVCDGMGGHAMGEVASQVVSSTICEYLEQASFDEGMEPVLKTAFKLASDALDAKAIYLAKVKALLKTVKTLSFVMACSQAKRLMLRCTSLS